MRIIVQSRRLFTSATVRAGKNAYSNTLLLPKTPFELRARAATREYLFRDRCTKDLYPWQLENNPKDLFILHDGPPYANGDVHSGHAMNKILKDIVNRYKILQGHKVWYRPGWDCHGLPIELKALEEIREKGKELTAVEIRALAKRRAQREIEKQKKAFMSWAVLGDWENPYLTMTKEYEIRQLRVFRDMMKKGYIYRQLKPVYWSPSSRSALAESELEYNEQHVSRSLHVRFPVTSKTPALKDISNLYAVIWTTTPWTIPANLAISVNPELSYSVVKAGEDHYLVATDLIEAFQQALGHTEPLPIVRECLGTELVGLRYRHWLTNAESPVIAGAHVTSESGTGLVHTAPDHGMEDYEVCQAMGIKPFGPVDDQGRYTKEVGDKLAGLDAFTEGAAAVIDALRESKAILKEEDYTHKYPYDWRTKKPVMLRATAQWFANVEDLQKTAVEALKSVRMVPEVSIRRLEQFTLSRKEWCISRQRAWGVPIPALYDVETGEALLTDASVEHIIRLFEEKGTDIWWEEADDAVFVAPEYRNNGRTYRRGYDTMDVWFDSGTSWTMIKERDAAKPVADIYLEGSDQHRGWFQSSLLTSIALTGKTPYSTLITHGFALDEQGRKMSKSLGNTIVPSLITEGGKDKKLYPAYGTDVLRMWVANCEYTRDVSIGPSITAQISEHVRKIRTTARFLLGNLFDFHHSEQVPYSQLKEIDRYMLHELTEFADRVTAAFDAFAYNKAMHHIQNFTTNDLSAFYFDVIKDRLYNERQAGLARRSAQTVLYHILQTYTTALAPVACHTAEEIYENYRNITPKPESTVFKLGWFSMEQAWRQQDLQNKWTLLKQLKGHVNQVLEAARQEKAIRSSNEANVDIAIDPSTKIGQLVHGMDPADLSELFVTSKVTLHSSHDGTNMSRYRREAELEEGTSCIIAAQPSSGHKCPRCWCYHSVEPDTLCARCTSVLH